MPTTSAIVMPSIRPKVIPQALIDALLYENGELYWIKTRQGVVAGTKTGPLGSTGYRRVTWNKQRYQAHRIVWAMHYGDTDLVVDHINRDKTDNRIENLRAITQRQNKYNSNRGVNWCNKSNVWRVRWSTKDIATNHDLFEAWCIRKSLEHHQLSSQSFERR